MAVAFSPAGQAPEGRATAAVGGLGTLGNTVTLDRPETGLDSDSRPTAGRVDPAWFKRRLRFERRQISKDWLFEDAREQVDAEHAAYFVAAPARCGWATGSHVGVHHGEKGARFSGVQTCSSIWACPTCSPVIRSRRSGEVQQAAAWWVAKHQGYFLFATFTLRHRLRDSLERSMKALTGAFTRLIRGAPWKRFRALHGIAHLIKSVEVTFSYDHGWHAHLHVLFFTEDVRNGAALEAARAWLTDRWQAMVVKEGGRMPDKEHGVDLRMVQDGTVVAEYITKLQEHDEPPEGLRERRWKIGQEMTRTDLKRGRKASLVPFDLLDLDGLDGEQIERARGYWLEYVETTKGRRATTWSRGLKSEAGIDEVSDDEILEEDAADVAEDVAVLLIARRNWRYVMNFPDLLARILELVEAGRADDVGDFVPILIPTG